MLERDRGDRVERLQPLLTDLAAEFPLIADAEVPDRRQRLDRAHRVLAQAVELVEELQQQVDAEDRWRWDR